MNNNHENEDKVVTLIEKAILLGRVIQFSYPSSPSVTLFAPNKIETSRNGPYVQGKLHGGNRLTSARNYSISKMSDIRITSLRFDPPKSVDRRKSVTKRMKRR